MLDSGNSVPVKPVGRKFIFSLALALFGTSMLDVLSSLFLVDLSKTYLGSNSLSSIALVSQIVTISSVCAIVFGILNGFLVVRIKHKTLLLIGTLCIVIGTIGCLLAPNLLFFQIFYPFDGIGTITVAAMCWTMIGEALPLEKRARAIGVVTFMGITSTAVGFALAGFFANIGGWRSYLELYVLPVAILAVAIAYFTIPNNLTQGTKSETSIVSSFKKVFLTKSAAACLIGNVFLTAGGVWSFFAATFWRQKFLLPVSAVGILTMAVVLVYAFGGFIGGRLVDRVGRKRFVIISWLVRGLLIISIVFMPDFYSALTMTVIATLIGGFSVIGSHALLLEQAPVARGTMMSFSGVFGAVGIALGTALGGLALTVGFELLGVTLGVLTLISALVILLFSERV
jgi:predicted MFS family arabinose efflux permease